MIHPHFFLTSEFYNHNEHIILSEGSRPEKDYRFWHLLNLVYLPPIRLNWDIENLIFLWPNWDMKIFEFWNTMLKISFFGIFFILKFMILDFH